MMLAALLTVFIYHKKKPLSSLFDSGHQSSTRRESGIVWVRLAGAASFLQMQYGEAKKIKKVVLASFIPQRFLHLETYSLRLLRLRLRPTTLQPAAEF